MSLTNQMLKNLEKNRTFSQKPLAFQHLDAPSEQRPVLKYIAWSILPFLLAGGIYAAMHYQAIQKMEQGIQRVHPIPGSSVILPPPQKTTKKVAITTTSNKTQAIAQTLPSVAVAQNKVTTPVAAMINTPATKPVIVNAVTTRAAPVSASTTSAPDTTLSSASVAAVTASQDQDNRTVIQQVKTPSREATNDPDTQYQNALNLISQDHPHAAIGQLRTLLSITPNYIDARITLATLLLERNKTDEAIALLQEGLSDQPGNPDLTMLYVRALISDNQFAAANAALATIWNTMATDPEYLATSAYVDQHLGKPEQAAAIYEKLLSHDPTNGRYLVGLGLSLEQVKKPNEALLIYQRALSDTQLSPDLQAFAQKRVAALGTK